MGPVLGSELRRRLCSVTLTRLVSGKLTGKDWWTIDDPTNQWVKYMCYSEPESTIPIQIHINESCCYILIFVSILINHGYFTLLLGIGFILPNQKLSLLEHWKENKHFKLINKVIIKMMTLPSTLLSAFKTILNMLFSCFTQKHINPGPRFHGTAWHISHTHLCLTIPLICSGFFSTMYQWSTGNWRAAPGLPKLAIWPT